MKISDYSVSLNSTNRYSEKRTTSYFNTVLTDSLQKGGGSSAQSFLYTKNGWMEDEEKPSLKKTLSEEDDNDDSFGDLFDQEGFGNHLKLTQSETSALSKEKNQLERMMEKIHNQIIDYFLRWLFGADYKEKLSGLSSAINSGAGGSSQGGVIYMASGYMQTYSECEETTFSGSGRVVNSEGMEIEFAMNFTLSRSFSAYATEITSTRTVMTDPLILNFDGDITGFSDQNFYFDLDCDGTEEEVTGLGRGSAFLALDKNGDGQINDGSELFGAQSGNGFADLAEYDDDGNGWIDENDSVFDRLRVFSVDSKGEKTLISLKESGVGALYLGSAETDYHVTGSTTANAVARIRRSGLFLYENGMVGNLQQVDLATYG